VTATATAHCSLPPYLPALPEVDQVQDLGPEPLPCHRSSPTQDEAHRTLFNAIHRRANVAGMPDEIAEPLRAQVAAPDVAMPVIVADSRSLKE